MGRQTWADILAHRNEQRPAKRTHKNKDNGLFRVNLRTLRIAADINQCELAKAIGVTQEAVSAWETGKAAPSLINTAKLCKIFDCSLDELVTVYKEDAADV